MGTFQKASDIDIAIQGRFITEKSVSALKHAFEESDLPFFVDVVQYETIDHPPFKKHIDENGVIVYRREEGSAADAERES